MKRMLLSSSLLLFSTLTMSQAQTASCSKMSTGQNASLNGFVPFPANDPWRQNVTNAMVDGNSDAIIATIGANAKVHPDFASGTDGGSWIGIPYQVVSGAPVVPVTYTDYGSESDAGPMPFPANFVVEGGPAVNPGGDAHALVLDRDNCFLYELYGTTVSSKGAISAASGAVWDLLNNNQRPWKWTSADAAGLPIFPGLARYDEVSAGVINHALRFTLQGTKAAMLAPAKHDSPTSSNSYAAPMGLRLRLRANFDISGFSPQAKVILTALKTYGMILADNGSSMYISGAPSSGWNNDDLHNLGKVTAANFEVLQETPLITAANIPTGATPKISTFTGIKIRSLLPGTPSVTTLLWNASGASYYVISPGVGAVRGNVATVAPTVTTTYTLYATNAYGETTSTFKVTVP